MTTYVFGEKDERSIGRQQDKRGYRFGKQIGLRRDPTTVMPTELMKVPSRVLVGTIDKLRPLVDPEPGLQDQGPYYIQGYKASDLEWRVYRMARMLGWDDNNMVFQTSIIGGRNPGGQMLDFVFYGPGSITVVNVNGDHWHKFGIKNNISEYKEQQVSLVMPSARVYSLYNADLVSDDIALMNLRKLVGRGM